MRKAASRTVTARTVSARKRPPVKSPTVKSPTVKSPTVKSPTGNGPAKEKDISPRKLLTLDEAGVIVGRSVDALRQLIFRKKFPYTRISGRIGVDVEELERFLKLSRKVTAEEAVERRTL